MDLFSDFCNICCKTDGGRLTNTAEDNMKHLKDTLITFLGHADIINHNIINLCQLCCKNLIRSNKFREMCFSNLIQLRQNVLDMKSKLENGTCAVENTLQIFVHEEVLRRKTFEKNEEPVSISTEHLAGDCGDVSVINTVTECNESQVGFTKESFGLLKCESESDEDFEFIKEEFDLKNEIENFALIESGGDVNIDVEVSAGKNSEGIVNADIESIKEELHVKQEKSISEDLELETITDEFGDDLNVAFEIANVRTIVTMQESGAKSITVEENVKYGMKLRSRGRKDESNTAVMNPQPNRPHVRKLRNGRCLPTQKSRAHERVYPAAKLYTCTVCSKSFKGRSKLIVHERIHNGDRPYECTVCGKAFTQLVHLTTHKRIHSGDRPYKCTVCNKACIDSSQLIVHERIHSGDKPFKCTVCNKAFSTSSSLTIHERIHSGDKPYKCSSCNWAFTNSSDLTKHKLTHSADRPFKCTVCTKAFTRSFSLIKHKRIHSGDRPYKCTVCYKAFAVSSTLTRHERIHSADRPFKCVVCNKTFLESSNLARHKRCHSDDRPHKCTICNKAFRDSEYLIRHERIHSGDRRYKCTICKKAFTDSSNLSRHKRSHSGQ